MVRLRCEVWWTQKHRVKLSEACSNVVICTGCVQEHCMFNIFFTFVTGVSMCKYHITGISEAHIQLGDQQKLMFLPDFDSEDQLIDFSSSLVKCRENTRRIPVIYMEMQESYVHSQWSSWNVVFSSSSIFEPNSSPRMAIDIIRPRNPLSKSTSIGVALEMLPPKTLKCRTAGRVWYNNYVLYATWCNSSALVSHMEETYPPMVLHLCQVHVWDA